MKNLLCLLLCFFFFSIQAGYSQTVFENTTVITMQGEEVLKNYSVLVKDDRIIAVAPAGKLDIPEGAVIIDGSGKYLMPGLAEMHGHIPSPNSPQAYTENVLFLYVAAGITTVRGMLGYPNQLELKEKINNESLMGPNLYLAGPSFNGNSVSSPKQADQKVRDQFKEGWHLLKVHPGLTKPEYDAMAHTANELGIRFGGHVPEAVGLVHALEMNQETFDHIDGYIRYFEASDKPITDAQLQEAVRLTKEAGAWIVPTQALWNTIIGASNLQAQKNFDELKYMPPQMVEGWVNSVEQRIPDTEDGRKAALQHAENRRQLLKTMNENGVNILMGTDAPQLFSVPGFSIHRELQEMVAAEMSPYEIIKSGTYNVGQYFSNEDDFGTIAEGQRADLILVNKNPLDDVAHIRNHAGVMVRGKWLSKEEIDKRLSKIEESY